MAHREFRKNSAEVVRVTPQSYEGHDLVDVRVYARNREGAVVPTKKGVSVNIDLVPELVEALEWALAQPCVEDPSVEINRDPRDRDYERLADVAMTVLSRHGLAVHWDLAERMVLSQPGLSGYTKWDLHFVLATRPDLFVREQPGCYRTRETSSN